MSVDYSLPPAEQLGTPGSMATTAGQAAAAARVVRNRFLGDVGERTEILAALGLPPATDPTDSWENFVDCLRVIEGSFGENDPDRYDCLAVLYQRMAYRNTLRAEQLRALARHTAEETA